MIKTALRVLLILFIFVAGLWTYVYFSETEYIDEDKYEVSNNIDSSLFLKKKELNLRREIPVVVFNKENNITKKRVKKTKKRKTKKKRTKPKKTKKTVVQKFDPNANNNFHLKNILKENKKQQQFDYIDDKEETIIEKLDKKIYYD